MSLRREAVRILGALGVCVLGLMGFMAYHEAMTLKEAVGWTLAGWLSIREIMSKVENVALGVRQGGPPLKEETEQ
ncbi:MAG: hypothetical protein C0510_06865 [Erythrobacter sp.]|nr:hypothetical protein [Erythrobacter sp.]